MRVTFDDCNTTDEVCGLFNKVFANQEQMEAKIVQNAQEIEALKPKKKGKSKMKSKGSASMRVIAILMLIVAVASLSYAAYVPTDITYEIASNPEMLATYLRDVTGTMISDSYLFTPTLAADAPPFADGRVWYNNTANLLQMCLDGTSWTNIALAGGNSLDAAYDVAEEITVDSGTAVTFTSPDNSGNQCLLLTQSDVSNDGDALSIANAANAGTAVSIDIDGTAGYDIQGTGDTWEVSITGVGDFDGLIVGGSDLTMENGQGINNVTDGVIEFWDDGAGEDFEINLLGSTGAGPGADIVLFTSDTAADTLEFDTIDDVNGVGNIYFDSAASEITLAANQNADDLLVQVTGALNASLDLRSAGTGDDAIIIRSTAGGIDVDALKSIVITSVENTADSIVIQATTGGIDILADAAGSGEDIDIASATGTVHIVGGEDATDAVDIDATGTDGGIDLDTTDGPITLTTAGAANGDMTLTVADAFNLTSTDTAQNGIHIEANGGTAESINLYSNQGTGASATTQHDASIQLQSDAGGISLYTTGNVADAIRIETNGGVDEFITINNLQGTGTDAITITANAAGGDVDINSILGSIFIEAEEDSATAISIIADGVAANGGIWIQNETGTGVTEDAVAIEIRATLGGIAIQSDADLDDCIVIRADGGTTSEMTITNDQGDQADSIEITSAAGGVTIFAGADDNITLTAGTAAGGVVFTNGQTRQYLIQVADVDLDGSEPPTLTSNGTDAQWRSASLEFDADPGGNDDVCYIQWIVPAGYIADSADLHVYWSFDTAEDAADECVIDGTVSAIAAGEDLDVAATVMAAVTSVITDASAEEGSLVKTSLDIEVEDIAVDDMVTIMFFFDEFACLMANSGTADVHYFVITYLSSE